MIADRERGDEETSAMKRRFISSVHKSKDTNSFL
jgi:hypothetical protein